MGDTWVSWLFALPIGGALLASLFFYLGGRRSTGSEQARIRLDALALASASAGLLLSMLVVVTAEGRTLFAGTNFTFSGPDRAILFVVNIALICSLFAGWGGLTRQERPLSVWSVALTSSLISIAVLAQDGLVSVLALLGAGVVAAGSACLVPLFGFWDASGRDEARVVSAKRVTGGLKHLSITVAGTGLLVVGIILLSRYGLTLENRALAQLGIGLLSIGLLVRVGAMPFAIASPDLIDAAPGAAINVLGAATPGVLLVGLHLLLPADSIGAGCCGGSAWVGAVAVLLAGVRALGVRQERSNTAERTVPGELLGATIALAAGWGLTGLLLGSEGGQTGAVLIALNIALAVPLAVISSSRVRPGSRLFGVGLGVGVASLLGLPPFGGFAGTLLVAQAAANLGGFWLLIMLLGSMMVAARWVALAREITSYERGSTQAEVEPWRLDAGLVMVVVLTACQLGLWVVDLGAR